MLVVIDESGCAGFRQGSSSHFVLGMIIFDSFADAEATANIIQKLKRDHGMKREFRFSSSNNRKRDTFFEAIKGAKFRIRIFHIDKKIIYSPYLQTKHDNFVSFCLKNLMKDSGLKEATVKIDGKGSRQFKKDCETYLRREVGAHVIKAVKFCNSETDVLIQLADMVVSAYSRPYHNATKEDAFKWRNMIESKIENVWNFR